MSPASTSLIWPARLSRLLETAWARGWATRPMLDPEEIVAAAVMRERASPAAGPWRARLDLLCSSLEEEAQLSALGRTIAYGQLVRIVASRIRAERWRSRHPEIAERPLPPPVILVGQMRSGTTRAHRLLACDPAFSHSRLFDTLEPVPLRRGLDRRPLSALAAMAMVRLCNPAWATIHPSWPFAPEEEFGYHAFSLWGAQFEGQFWVPAFVAASEALSDKSDIYADFRLLLQLRAFARDEAGDRVPLLKAPQFCVDLDPLVAAFPDARVIRLSRAPDRVVASGASLAWNQMRIQSDHADRAAIGAEWLRKTALREDRLTSSLSRGVEHLTLDYDEVSNDWRGAMHRVYAYLGRPLLPMVEQRMARVTASTAHRGHHYALEDFGLDEGRVRAALA